MEDPAWVVDVFAGNACALACKAGSPGVTEISIFQLEQQPGTSASRSGTLAGEGACVPGNGPEFSVGLARLADKSAA